jgi:hypothetical protein
MVSIVNSNFFGQHILHWSDDSHAFVGDCIFCSYIQCCTIASAFASHSNHLYRLTGGRFTEEYEITSSKFPKNQFMSKAQFKGHQQQQTVFLTFPSEHGDKAYSSLDANRYLP